ncbi:MAG TPA: hypothetical protein VGL56_13870 [Fimbriimonadaceae bacterium]
MDDDLYKSFTQLGEDADSDVEFALEAQRDVVFAEILNQAPR